MEELAHMNWIRFSTSSQNSIFDSDDPKLSYACVTPLMRTPWVWAESARSRKIVTTSGPDRSDGNKSMAIPDCSMVPWTTEINARHLPLHDASTTWMLYSWGNPLHFCACMCLCMCVWVCMCDPQDSGLESWCARETGAVACPIPKAEYLPFVKNSLKLVVCVCVCVETCDRCDHKNHTLPLPYHSFLLPYHTFFLVYHRKFTLHSPKSTI